MDEPTREENLSRHYEFGRNWQGFLRVLDDRRITAAQRSLTNLLGVKDLAGKTFLDVGSGSGVFSLGARRLGAQVHSFDYDGDSVACTRELKRRYYPDDAHWTIEEGSVLDIAYLNCLGKFDVVYAWGVLHHTGAMWQALHNILIPLAENGTLAVAIYNDQGWISGYWRRVKRAYTTYPVCRPLIACSHAPIVACTRIVPRLLNGRLTSQRGMSFWYDLKDWLGGYPFEVATAHAIIDFYRRRDCALVGFKPCGDPSGNNEFVFRKKTGAAPRRSPSTTRTSNA